MSDFQGRGGRGGDRGRGGRGRGRGDFEGRGGGRGGRGGFDNRGGRGGGATFSGFHHEEGSGGRGRGGGDFRGGDRGGGRGGRGGGRGGYDGPPVFKLSTTQSFPLPDPETKKLEDRVIKTLGGDLTSQMAKVQISSDTAEDWFPARPAYGTNGTPVKLWANYFQLKVQGTMLVKYALHATRKDKKSTSKEPRPPAGMKLRSILQKALVQVKKDVVCVTDFKQSVYALKPFSLNDDKKVIVPYDDEGKDDEYEVVFNGPTNVDLPALMQYITTMKAPTQDLAWPKFSEEINALTVITGFHARMSPDSASLGSRHFPLTLPQEQYQLGGELNRLIRGYFQSARPATGRLLLNVNVAHGVFRVQGPANEYWIKCQSSSRDFRGALTMMNSGISKLRAQVKVLSDKKGQKPRIIQKVICGLADKRDGTSAGPGGKGGKGGKQAQPQGNTKPPIVSDFGAGPKQVQFWLRSPAPAGTSLTADAYCTVADYYLKRYGYTAEENLPVVNVGSKGSPVYMPAELVNILDGQALRRKTTSDETRDMIKNACRQPAENAKSITTIGRQVLGLDGNDHLTKFGISVGKNLLTVEGRELPPPSIKYQGQARIAIQNGEWNMNKVKFVKPGKPINRFCCVHVYDGRRKPQDLKGPVQDWVAFLRSMGLKIADRPETYVTVGVDTRWPLDELRKTFRGIKQHNPEYVFLVLPGSKTDTTVYNAVKTLAESKQEDFGYMTSVVLEKNLAKTGPKEQLFANLGLKVNLKRGGVNHFLSHDLDILKEPTMIVGYDVTHPTNLGGNASGLPSLVGMVANTDNELGQWPPTMWRQDGKVEMLNGDLLVDGFKERLQLYQDTSKSLPKNLVIYRDGVSEGQFQQVLKQELPSIRSACKSLYPPNEQPKVCIIVSVKRHQTRFYPTDPTHATKGSNNVKPGTIVDRGVTMAPIWDFFLTAHKGLQGTARPAHYTVLIDEVFRSKYGPQRAANELEKLTFELCHLFGRATKAVSICPPAYYADILCTRARVYLSDLFDNSDTMSVSTSRTNESTATKIAVHDRIANTMFYM